MGLKVLLGGLLLGAVAVDWGEAAAQNLRPLPSQVLPKVRFISFGDFGTGASIQHQIAQAMQKKCAQSGCDFALTLGDNIYNDGVSGINDPQFLTKFEQPYAALHIPFYMILGNHDYRGNVEAQVAYTQKSKKWKLPQRYYHFHKGPVTFYALDTNNLDATQISYFKQARAQSKTPWNIVFGHHPRYSDGVYKNAQPAGLIPLMDSFCGKMDFYLAGHEHNKQHFKPVCGTEHLIVGTGAGLRDITQGPNSRLALKTYGFAWFEITPKQLTFELLNEKGEVEYRYQLQKKKAK